MLIMDENLIQVEAAKDMGWDILRVAITIGIGVLAAWVLLKLNHFLFRKIAEKHQRLHLLFFERVLAVVIIIACAVVTISSFIGLETIWQTILGGTAITSAVLAFAAQDVIKNVLGGLMISLNKPFEIGNRIELEDGTAGIVEDMNPRHVVLRGIDTLRYLVPNSKINTMKVTNYSYLREDRAIHFTFPVGYGSDMALVKKVIEEAVAESPRSMPVARREGEEPSYGPVYFISFADSALMMAVTVYYEPGSRTEEVKNDINTRVREALIANGIEIPYPHVTLTGKEQDGIQ